MNKETLRMQMLSGVITESEYKAKLEELETQETKKSLNENFVGMGMVGNIFDRKKTDYEMAFEHFTKGTSLNEEMEDEEEFDLNKAFAESPRIASYDDVLDVIESYEDEDILNDFKAEFPEGEPISRDDYSEFAMSLIDDMSEISFIQANWISMFDEDIFDKAGLNESDKPGTAKERMEEETIKEESSRDDEKLYLAFIKAANFIKGGGSDTEAWEMMWDEYPYM
jgi:hypothetical protein